MCARDRGRKKGRLVIERGKVCVWERERERRERAKWQSVRVKCMPKLDKEKLWELLSSQNVVDWSRCGVNGIQQPREKFSFYRKD